MYQKVQTGQDLVEVIPKTGQGHMTGQVQTLDLALQFSGQRTPAEEEQPQVRVGRYQRGQGTQEKAMAFALDQLGHDTQPQSLGGHPGSGRNRRPFAWAGVVLPVHGVAHHAQLVRG